MTTTNDLPHIRPGSILTRQSDGKRVVVKRVRRATDEEIEALDAKKKATDE